MRILLIVLLLALYGVPLAAQVPAAASRPALGPRNRALLEQARTWATGSPLGDLTRRDAGPGDIELRYWGGFADTGTEGIVLRRRNGRWQGWLVRVVRGGPNGADRLDLVPLKPELAARAWETAAEAGAPILPPTIQRTWLGENVYAHVVELRVGKAYRASVIACAVPPETPDDYRVQKVAGVLARAFPAARLGCTR